jgi:hypothetical protein
MIDLYPPERSQKEIEYIFPEMPKEFGNWCLANFNYKKGERVPAQKKKEVIELYIRYLVAYQKPVAKTEAK